MPRQRMYLHPVVDKYKTNVHCTKTHKFSNNIYRITININFTDIINTLLTSGVEENLPNLQMRSILTPDSLSENV